MVYKSQRGYGSIPGPFGNYTVKYAGALQNLAANTAKRTAEHLVQGLAKKFKGDPGLTADDNRHDSHTSLMVTQHDNNANIFTARKKSRKRLTRKQRLFRKKKYRFKKKVRKALRAKLKNFHYVVNYTDLYSETSAVLNNITQQTVFPNTSISGLAIGTGNLFNTTSDVGKIADELNDFGVVDNALAVTTNFGKNKIFFPFRATMKCTIQVNNTEFTATNPLILDVYECVAVKDIGANEVVYNTPYRAWNQIAANECQNFSGQVIAPITAKGAQPFDTPLFRKHWKILNITRLRLTQNEPFHYHMTTKGFYNGPKFNDLHCVKGVTKSLMLVAAPTYITTLPANYDIKIAGISKHISYKMPNTFARGATYTMRSAIAL